MNKQLISLQEYQRIFETIYSVLFFLGLNPTKNCAYFSIIGAFLLHEHFGIACKSYSGGASYYLSCKDDAVLSFVEQVGPNSYAGTINAFHSWNQNEDFIIDFQAPLFPEMINEKYQEVEIDIPAKMFQRKLAEQCQTPLQFRKNGDFCHQPDNELTEQIVDIFVNEPLNMDIVKICSKWFVKPISKMEESIEIKLNTGQSKSVFLQKIKLLGAW
ncbi:DUF2026 family protein [Desulfuromonas acetoxidans]|uniref:DUF2026 family protein n=1 Tax=Desulfuromonas acetoxidans TaxID=891 RepID=UPI00292E874C|nr:DUF2026 family protein [Desulfuromonas acetoxidans]